MGSETERLVSAALAHRLASGRHLHHRDCIHNLPPEEQIAWRGWTVERWRSMGLSIPQQITPEDWECESPFEVPDDE
jgi:hypothetical protein